MVTKPHRRKAGGARPYVALLLGLLLLAPTAPAQTRKRAGRRFSVTYSLSQAEDSQPYEGYLSVLPGGLEFQGQRYEQERMRARVKGRAYSEKFSCAEMTGIQFHPGYKAIDVAVRGRHRFIYCPHDFAVLQAAITQLCKEQKK